MQFNVKGITFTRDELETVKLTEIKTQTISHAHYFHFLGESKAILLLRAGDFVEPSFVTKYLEKGMQSIYRLPIISDDDLLTYKKKWTQLKQARSQTSQMQIRDEIIQKVAEDFWHSAEKSYLSFVIASFEEFYNHEPLILENYQEQSMVMYTRTLITSSLVSIVSLCNGIVDYYFIKDLYNTAYLLDYGFIAYGSFPYVLAHACEVERNNPGQGVEYLKKLKRSEDEINKFLHHPELSYSIAREFSDRFHYPEILEFILVHHEKCDGSGFPKGYSYSGMSDSEIMLMFCDYMTPYQEHIFCSGDGKQVLKDYFKQLCALESKYLLPINKMIANWESMMNWTKMQSEDNESVKEEVKEVVG